MPTLTANRTRLPLHLDDKLLMKYERHATEHHRELEDELADRLKRCVNHTAHRPLYFDDVERNELERLTGGHVTRSNEMILARLRARATIDVSGVKIELPDGLLQRIQSRVWRGQTRESVIKREVMRGLEEFCGLR